MKLVRERLYEESSAYSTDQMKKDYDNFISVEEIHIKPEDKERFFNEVIIPAQSDIRSANELYDIVSSKMNSYLSIK